MDVRQYNRQAWDRQVANGNRWTVPVSAEAIAAAKQGQWSVVLTPDKPVPKDWFLPLQELDLLGLASGGGQQVPILAAAGANVTVIDNSPRQLEQDNAVASRDGLQIQSVLGDMRDLSMFPPDSFDVVFSPCSVSFVPEVQTIFTEAYRVLRSGGRLICGFTNPARFLFDEDKLQQGEFEVRHSLPYSDQDQLTEDEKKKLRAEGEPFIFGHTLEDLIGGQLQAGFVIRDLYEDRPADDPLSAFLPMYLATLAEKR